MALQRFSRYRERISVSSEFSEVTTGLLKKYRKSDNKLLLTTPVKVSVPVQAGSIQKTWDNVNPGPPYRTGGPFASFLVELPSSEVRDAGVNRTAANFGADPNNWYEYTGGFTNPDFSSDSVSLSRYKDISPFVNDIGLVPNMDAFCAEVYAKLAPQISKADLGVDLAESRDLPSMLKTSARGLSTGWKAAGGSMNLRQVKMAPKGAANHFLNHQFGWRPFVGSLSKCLDTYANSKKYLDDIKRINGTWVKRVRTIDNDESSQVVLRNFTPWGVEPVGVPGFLPSGLNLADCFMKNKTILGNSCKGYHILEEVIKTKVWAAGSFKFYRPIFDINDWQGADDSALAKLRQQLALYGAEISPAVVYHATRWTWLIDWFTSLGKIVDNISNMLMNQMVARYMYLMHHHVREYKFTNVHHFHAGDRTSTWSRISDVKRRNEGPSPFSFCFGWDQLTPSQLAILGALGISRR